ncbi:MAG: hypothetical protein ACK6CU_22835 [Deltaproteobacteria bacterium]
MLLYGAAGGGVGYLLAEHYPVFAGPLERELCQPFSPCRDGLVPVYALASAVVGMLLGLSMVRMAGNGAHIVGFVASISVLAVAGYLQVTVSESHATASAAAAAIAVVSTGPELEAPFGTAPVREQRVAGLEVLDSSEIPDVCEIESAFDANEIAALRRYPEGSTTELEFDLRTVHAGYTQPWVEAAGCVSPGLPFDDREWLAGLSPGDHVVASCTFSFYHQGTTHWENCDVHVGATTRDDDDASRWHCVCVRERLESGATTPVTSCRRTSEACRALAARATGWRGVLLSVDAPCTPVEGIRLPSVELREGEELVPSAVEGAWQLIGRCALPAPEPDASGGDMTDPLRGLDGL